MTVLVRTTFWYEGYHRKTKNSHCELQIFNHNSKYIVIATELDSNRGTSITNRIEHIASMILKKYELDILNTVWIEHYPPTAGYPPLADHRYSQVTFAITEPEFKLPNWRYMTTEEVAELIGENAPTIQ